MLYVLGTILWGILGLVWKQPPLRNPSRRTLTLSASFYHLLTHITHISSLSPLPSPPWAHSNSHYHFSLFISLACLLSPSLSPALSLSPLSPFPSRVFLRVFRAVGLFRLEFLFISVVQFPWSLWSRLWSVELPLSKLGIPGPFQEVLSPSSVGFCPPRIFCSVSSFATGTIVYRYWVLLARARSKLSRGFLLSLRISLFPLSCLHSSLRFPALSNWGDQDYYIFTVLGLLPLFLLDTPPSLFRRSYLSLGLIQYHQRRRRRELA